MSPENKKYSQFKSKLTRAVKSKNPDLIIKAVEDFESYYKTSDEPIPDGWHRWQRAADDANYEKKKQFFRPLFEN